MEEFFSIHTATRRYCINIINNINQKYELFEHMLSSININDGKEKINNIYGEINKIYPQNEIIDDGIRVDIIKVILVKIETIDPGKWKYHTIEQGKEFIKVLYKDSKVIDEKFYSATLEHITNICDKEKRNLNKFIHQLTRDSLSKVKPLFYRRCISTDEVNRINSKLMKTLKESSLIKDNLLIFKVESFDLDREILIEILKKHKNTRVYEINTGATGSNSYILDIEALNLQRNDGFNIYWCSEQVDWIIEKNHEGWYHFYGDWFTKELKDEL